MTTQLLYLYIVSNALHRRCVAERKGKLPSASQQPGLSVVITASNQETSLAKHLPHILEQDYPNFEVIVVDDNSKDDTPELLERLAQRYPHLYTTHTSDSIRYISHKKLALTLGIKAAKNEWIVFIEPDCYPVSNKWLSQLARHCTDSVDVVLGYSNYESKSTFINHCCTYDTLLQQMSMLGLALRGAGYMGIGKNMVYRRELFFTHKGYSRHLDLERGEDDLFINEHVDAHRITADISADSVVRCSSTNNSTWLNEKLSRLFMRRKMHGIYPHLTEIDSATRILLYISFASCIIISILNHWWLLTGIVTALWTIYLVCRISVFHHIARDLNERKHLMLLPILGIMQPCWELYFRLRLFFTSKDMHLRRKV